MGAIGDSMAAFAQPLIDQTDGSHEQIQKAFSIAMLCWNLASLPDAEHDEILATMGGELGMDDKTFRDFRRVVLEPMIRRHRQMFPGLDPARKQAPREG